MSFSEEMSSIDRVRAFMAQRGFESRIREFDVSSATVALAAEAVGCEPARIAKTLAFRAGERTLLLVAAGDARVDNARFKGYFHAKGKMLTAEETFSCIGHAPGGVCPFAVNDGVEIYLDESLRRFGTVYPACGSANSAIPLSPEELEGLSGGTWIDVCKAWREEESA
jgi:Uncharacterized conserved protein